MKIFQVVPYYPPHIGGMEFYVQRLSEELAAHGHEVTVFTSSQNDDQTIDTVNHVRIHRLKIMTKAYNVPIVPSLFSQLVNVEKPDIIHTHQYPVFFSDIAAAVSGIRKIPIIVHVHVVSDAKSPLSGFVSKMYYSSLGLGTLRTADCVIVPSLAYKTKISKMHVIPDKIQVIPYGIDVKKFSENTRGKEFKAKHNCKGSKVILSVGRLNYQKGFHYLIQAMPTVIEQIPNVKLVIVGEGELLPYLKQLAESLGIRDSVVFTGAISQAEISDAYSACEIFVLPSLFESFGISLIEAQAAGKPVIGTRTGGLPEAIREGATGFLVEPCNSSQLAREIIHILSDEKLAFELGTRGQEFVWKHFSLEATIKRMTFSYQKIAGTG
jgi:glycosyltransferase involved in cell wall biosynthesis